MLFRSSNGNADTQFVPYFWPDETDPAPAANNYIKDYYANDPLKPLGFEGIYGGSAQDSVQSILKYNGSNNGGSVTIAENGPKTMGPNKACPDEIVPLTTSASTINSAIGALSQKYGGGTIVSEGLMWGWRVLSPGAPFTEAAPYGKTKKYLVIMTDGQNDINENNLWHDAVFSDYTAYGYLGLYETRLAEGPNRDYQNNVITFPEARAYFDTRLNKACTNAKAAGITVIAMLFRDNSPAAEAAMRKCASGSENFYYASNAGALQTAFDAISTKLINLRLTK